MANVNLASLKFPGLTDTYEIFNPVAILSTIASSNADIEAALSAGKTPLLQINNLLGASEFCWYVEKASTTLHYFCGIDKDGKIMVAVCNNGTWTVTHTGLPAPSDSTPQPLGTAAPGSSAEYSRANHVHAMPSASDVGAVASNQGVANAGKFLVVGSDGVVAPVTMTAWNGGSY